MPGAFLAPPRIGSRKTSRKSSALSVRKGRLMKSASRAQSNAMEISRRDFIQTCVVSASAAAALPILGCQSLSSNVPQGAPSRTLALDQDWLFGGELKPQALMPQFDDTAFARVTL